MNVFRRTHLAKSLAIISFSAFFYGCSPTQEENSDGASGELAKTSMECPAVTLNLENPSFEFDYERGRPHGWLIHQHAGDKTYIVETKPDGVLEINNFGKQYWMSLIQRYPAEELVGHEVEFSVDIKLNLDPTDWLTTLEPGGGLNIVVRGTKDGGHNRKALLYRSVMPNEPRHGQVDWRRISHRFSIPEGANLLEVGFLHQAHGEMWLRNPELTLIDPSDGSDCHPKS